MRNMILLALMVSGCAVDPEHEVYTCTVLYRCVGAETVSARVGLTCAQDEGQANEVMTSAMIEAMPEACPSGWAYVRPLCAPYEGDSDRCDAEPAQAQ